MPTFQINNLDTPEDEQIFTSPELLDIAPAGIYRREGFECNFAIVLDHEERVVLRVTAYELWSAEAMRSIRAKWIKVNAKLQMNVMEE